MIKQVTIITIVTVFTMWIFRINDPYKILLPCLLIILSLKKTYSSYSFIDKILICITLFDIFNWFIHPYTGLHQVYVSATCLCSYFLLRQIIQQQKDKEFFIKIISIPITITLFLTIVSFSLFVENIHDAGFVDTYSFRFLFTPIGYFTNAWSSICFLLLGIIIYSYYNMPHWRIFFGIIGAITLIIILLSFSRAAIIAWSIYFFILLLLIQPWQKKLIFLAICIGIYSSIWIAFPTETVTTLGMNKTIIQQQSTEGRVRSTKKAIKLSNDNILIGAGSGQYNYIIDKDLNQNSAHAFALCAPNIITQLLIEQGVIGLTLYSLLFFATIIIIFRKRKQKITWIIGGCFLSITIKEMTISIMLNEATMCLLVYILLAFIQSKGIEEAIQPITMWIKYATITIVGLCFIGFEFCNWRIQNSINLVQKGIVAFENKNYDKAIRYLEQTTENLPILINKAMLAINSPDSVLPPQYITQIETKISKYSTTADIYITYIQAKLMLRKGEYEKSYHAMQKLIKKFPNNASFQFDYARILYHKRLQSEAVLALKNALYLRPSLWNAEWVNNIFASNPIFKEKVLTALIFPSIVETKSPNACARYGYLFYKLGKKSEAFYYLQKASDIQPGLITPWLLMGKIYEEQEKTEEANLCFKRYNLLIKGAFNNDNHLLQEEQKDRTQSKLLFSGYAMNFQGWYCSPLLY